MKYERFEELPVWKAAADLAVQIFTWSSHAWFRGKGDLANQIQRAALSISNNIAEGFERGTKNELLQFLYIARGSAGEVRSMLAVVEMMDVNQDLRSEIADLKAHSEGISRQLGAWSGSLQNSEIEGPRCLNDKTRNAFDQKQRREAFQQKLDATNEEARRKREGEI